VTTIAVEVWLYGPLARYAGPAAGSAYASVRLELADGATMADLLARLGLPTEERGITLVNGSLSALPGVQPDLAISLRDGDRVAFFHLKSMWPYQYRNGTATTAELERGLAQNSQPFHHRPTGE